MLYSGLDKPERPRAVLSRKQLKLTYKSATFVRAGETVSRPFLHTLISAVRRGGRTRTAPPGERIGRRCRYHEYPASSLLKNYLEGPGDQCFTV